MIRREGNICQLSGDVTIDTVPDILDQLRSLIQSGVDTVDYSGVQNVDSSALGLIFSCRREARLRNQTLKITGLSQRVLNLASLYGVADQVA